MHSFRPAMRELPASRMTTARNHIFTFCLLAIFLALNSLAYPQILTHTFHHSHHTADTHSTPLCFWVCSAGQMEEASSPFFLLSSILWESLFFPPSALSSSSSNLFDSPVVHLPSFCAHPLNETSTNRMEPKPLAWRCVHFPKAKASLQEV